MTGFFRVFGVVAITIVLGSVAFWILNRERPHVPEQIEAPAEGSGDAAPAATLERFFQIQDGMTYDEVVTLVGEEGVLFNEIGRAPDSDGPAKKTIYTWSNPDGSRMTLVFESGKVVAKEQFDLE